MQYDKFVPYLLPVKIYSNNTFDIETRFKKMTHCCKYAIFIFYGDGASVMDSGLNDFPIECRISV